jgi:hypothetical protein
MIRRFFTRREVTSAAGKAAGPGARRARRSRPALESLEGRTLLSFAGSEHRVSLNPQASDNFESDNASSFNGPSVAVWVNTFSGTDHDIWAQRYDQLGQAAGAPIQVDFLGSDDSYVPHVSMDYSGRFVVTWEDLNRDGTYSVMMRYYNSSGVPLTGITQVSAPGSYDYDPDVAASNGSFVITWAQPASPTNGDIYAERFVVSNGVPQGQGIFLVNSDGQSEARPSVAMQTNGIFAIAYERQSKLGSSDWDILASQYDGNGALVRGDVPINNDPSTELNPSISMDNNGNAVVAYQEQVGSSTGIYANRLSAAGVLGGRITVQDAGGINETNPSVASTPTVGPFVVAYDTPSGVQLTEIGSNDALLATLGPVAGVNPAISADVFNRFVVTDTKFNSSTHHYDVFSRRDFLPSGVESLVHPASGVFTHTDTQTDNASSPGANGFSVAVWLNNASGDDNDIYAQRFDNLGRRLGSPIPVDTTTANSQRPHVAMDSGGRFVVTWENLTVDGTSAVMYRYFNLDGTPVTPIRQLSPNGVEDFDPDVAASAGSFVISYTRTLSPANHDILAERFVVSGNTVTPQGIFAVNNDANDEGHSSVAMSPSGQTTIAYQWRLSSSDWDILASQYNGGTLVRSGIHVNFFDGLAELNPSVSADSGGNVVVAYERLNNGHSGVYANRVAWSTGAVSPVITVRDVAGRDEVNPSIALSQATGDFVVSYDLDGTFTSEVTEVNAANAAVAVSGPFFGFDQAISIDGLNRYMVTYTQFNPDPNGTHSFDIYGRRSFLN